MQREPLDHLPQLHISDLPADTRVAIARIVEHVVVSSPVRLPWGGVRLVTRDSLESPNFALTSVEVEELHGGSWAESLPVFTVALDGTLLKARDLTQPAHTLPHQKLPRVWSRPGAVATHADVLRHDLFTALADVALRLQWHTDPAELRGQREQHRDRLLARVRTQIAVAHRGDAERDADTYIDKAVAFLLGGYVLKDPQLLLANARALQLEGGWERRYGLSGDGHSVSRSTIFASLSELSIDDTEIDGTGTVTARFLDTARDLGGEWVDALTLPWLGRQAAELSDEEIVRHAHFGTNSAAYLIEHWMDQAEKALVSDQPFEPLADLWQRAYRGPAPHPSQIASELDGRWATKHRPQLLRLTSGEGADPTAAALVPYLGTGAVREDDQYYAAIGQTPVHFAPISTHADFPDWLAFALVGPAKPLGDLQIDAAFHKLGMPPEALVAYARTNGNEAEIVTDGALLPEGFVVAWNEATLQQVLTKHQQELTSAGWPTTPRNFAVAAVTRPAPPEVMAAMNEAYLDPFTEGHTERYRSARALAADYIRLYGPAYSDTLSQQRASQRRRANVPELLDTIPDGERPLPAGLPHRIGPNVLPPEKMQDLAVGDNRWRSVISDEYAPDSPEWRRLTKDTKRSLRGRACGDSGEAVRLVAALQLHGIRVEDVAFEEGKIQLYVPSAVEGEGPTGMRSRLAALLRGFEYEYRMPSFLTMGIQIKTEQPETRPRRFGRSVGRMYGEHPELSTQIGAAVDALAGFVKYRHDNGIDAERVARQNRPPVTERETPGRQTPTSPVVEPLRRSEARVFRQDRDNGPQGGRNLPGR